MKAIYALYADPKAAARAVDRLRVAGVGRNRITILSERPLEGFETLQEGGSSWMTWIAALGGLAGLVSGYALTSTTQQLWPLNTGGMPVVTNWTNLIVMFELTMLGAVLSTVATFLLTARLPRRRPKLYDEEISNGKILVGVANPLDGEAVERALRAGGDSLLKTLA